MLLKILFAASFIAILASVNNLSQNTLGTSKKALDGAASSTYSIAIIGDSMVDTMGEQLEYLQKALKKRYPQTTFYYYNYGMGSKNVEEGINNFNSPFTYKTRNFVPLATLHPDIIIVGSFAYNPFYPHNRDRHWNSLTKLVQMAKDTGADVYMLAEIAPLGYGFGKGPGGVNWEYDVSYKHSLDIVELLENAMYISQDHLKVPLIDAYTPTKANGKFGTGHYTDPNDGIHPSVAGHQLMAELIAAKIKLK